MRELISIQSRIGFFCQHSTASFWSFLKLHIFDQARFFRPLATQWFLMLSYFYLTSYLTNDMNWLELRLQLNWIIHIQTHAAKLFLSVFKKYKYIKYALYKPKLLSYILCRNGTYSVDTTVLPSTFTSMSEYTITSCGVFSVFSPDKQILSGVQAEHCVSEVTWLQNCGHPHYRSRKLSKRRPDPSNLSCETDLEYPYSSG